MIICREALYFDACDVPGAHAVPPSITDRDLRTLLKKGLGIEGVSPISPYQSPQTRYAVGQRYPAALLVSTIGTVPVDEVMRRLYRAAERLIGKLSPLKDQRPAWDAQSFILKREDAPVLYVSWSSPGTNYAAITFSFKK